MTTNGEPIAETHAPRGKRSLWRSFVIIAQPSFFPGIRGGSWATLLLMVALLIFLFGLLFLFVTGIALMADHFAPAATAKIAGGLVVLLRGVFHSRGWLLVAAALVLPAIVFTLFGRHLRVRRQAWILLAIVLLLSLITTRSKPGGRSTIRYSLVHLRDNTESIAFYQGEKSEIDQISGRFLSVLRNFGLLIGWQRNLSFFLPRLTGICRWFCLTWCCFHNISAGK